MCRFVIQRCLRAKVTVDSKVVGEIGRGLLVLCGIHKDDTQEDLASAVSKMCKMRLFEDDGADSNGRWQKSVGDLSLQVLLVSQFTLNATFKGRKPNFNGSMKPELASGLFQFAVDCAKNELGGEKFVQTGSFGQRMEVELVNDGPVTIVLDSKNKTEEE